MDIKHQYNGFAQHYVAQTERYFSTHEDVVRAFMVSQLSNLHGKRLLDIGCGAGRDIALYESLGAEVYGVEPSEEMLAIARQKTKHPERFVAGDWENLPFDDAFFDAATARFSLHYNAFFDRPYAEGARVLKHGAPLVFTVDHPFSTEEKQRSYGTGGITTILVYDDTVSISFPNHTLGEYLSDVFFSHFQLLEFLEGREDKTRPTPDFLGFSAKKK